MKKAAQTALFQSNTFFPSNGPNGSKLNPAKKKLMKPAWKPNLVKNALWVEENNTPIPTHKNQRMMLVMGPEGEMMRFCFLVKWFEKMYTAPGAAKTKPNPNANNNAIPCPMGQAKNSACAP